MGGKMYLAFLAIGIVCVTGQFGPKMGPYDIEIEKLASCEDQGSGKIVFSTRITNKGRGKYYYNENFTLQVPADENLKAHVDVQKFGNGGWRPKSFQYTVKSCQDLWKMIGDQIKSVMKSSGHEEVDKCPIPVAEYKVDNWEMRLNLEKNVPVMEYGKYRGIIKWFYKKELVGCIMGYIEMVPKAKLNTRN